MLAEAKRECDRLIGEAREQAVREASQTEIVKIAERQASDIVEDARRQARETRLEMEDWADGILSTLEVNFLTSSLSQFGAVESGSTSARRKPWSRGSARSNAATGDDDDSYLSYGPRPIAEREGAPEWSDGLPGRTGRPITTTSSWSPPARDGPRDHRRARIART